MKLISNIHEQNRMKIYILSNNIFNISSNTVQTTIVQDRFNSFLDFEIDIRRMIRRSIVVMVAKSILDLKNEINNK